MPNVNRPRSLAVFLAEGGDPTTLCRWGSVVDDAIGVLVTSPRHRQREAHYWLWLADAIENGTAPGIPMADGTTGHFDDECGLLFRWQAEMNATPTVARWFISSLPDTERYKAEQLLDVLRRPYPLDVAEPSDVWSCHNCGEYHGGDGARALVISDRRDDGGGDDLPLDSLTYCAACIGIAAQALNGVEVSL